MSGPATQVASEHGLGERQKKEKEVMELEVRCDLHPFRRNVIPTPSQGERKRRELEREKQEKEVRDREEGLKVRCDPISSNGT